MLELRYAREGTVDLGFRAKGSGIWRYGAVLPSQSGVTHGEGATPLLPVPGLAAEIGIGRLLLKDEGRNPTGSVHDRGSACLVTEATRTGAQALAMASQGASGVSLAAYASRAKLGASILFPVSITAADVNDARTLGATVTIRNNYTDSDFAGLRNVTPGYEPFRLEGMKTLGFELAEELDGNWPSAIVYPCATGLGLAAVWKAVLEMEALGVASSPRPKLIGVQTAGCAPLVRAFEEGRNQPDPWEGPRSASRELCLPHPFAGEAALAAVRASGGLMLSVTDTEMLDGVAIAARQDGVLLGLEGGACVGAIRHLLNGGFLDRNARVVLINTVGGRKTNALGPRLPRPASEQDKLGGLITPR